MGDAGPEGPSLADRRSGPDPQGSPPEAAPPPSGGPSASGAPPTGHPTDSSAGPHPLDGQGPAGDESSELSEEEAAREAVESSVEARRGVRRELAKVAAERDEYLDQLRHTRADFENYRKRILRQQTEHLERAAEGLAEKLLPVLDTFDAALAHGTGYEQVHASLMSTLEKEGLERIHPEGKPFDPEEADAVAHEAGDGEQIVTEVLRSGYRWKGRVIRPAMVKVRG